MRIVGMACEDEALDRLLAEAACTRLLHAYGRAIDWQDRAGLEKLFWPDANIDLGFFTGDAAQAIDFLMANAARSERRFHATSNSVLRVEGDVALADSCCITHAVGSDGAGGTSCQLFLGRYLDRFEKRGGEWRFAERLFVMNGYHADGYAEALFLEGVLRADGFQPDHTLFRFR